MLLTPFLAAVRADLTRRVARQFIDHPLILGQKPEPEILPLGNCAWIRAVSLSLIDPVPAVFKASFEIPGLVSERSHSRGLYVGAILPDPPQNEHRHCSYPDPPHGIHGRELSISGIPASTLRVPVPPHR